MTRDDRFHADLLDAIDHAVIAIDPDGPITYCNRAAERAFGWRREEVQGRLLVDLLPAEGYTEDPERIREVVRSGQPWSGRFEAHGAAGKTVPLHVRITPVRDADGAVVGLVGLGIDGARMEELEQALHASEDRFQVAFRTSPDAVTISRLGDGLFLEVNDAFTAICGWTAEETVGRLTADETIWADPADRQQAVAILQRHGRVENLEVRLRHRDGSGRWVLISARLIDFGGEACVLAVARDIQDRRDVQLAVQRERDRAQTYLDIAGTILVALDRDGRVTMLNRNGCEVLGYTRDEAMGRDWFDTFLLPDQRDPVREVFDALMAGQIEPVEYFENAVVDRGGDERLISWHNSLLFDDDGAITGTLSSGEDITERRLAEERLADSERLYRGLYQAAGDGITIIRDETVVDCNDNSLTLLGRSRDELIGLAPWDYSPAVQPDGRDSRDKAREVIEAAVTGGTSRFEWLHSRPDGSSVLVDIVLDAVEIGGIQYIQAVLRDIQAQKDAEEALRVSEQRFRTLFEASPLATVYADPQGTILGCNRQFALLHGHGDDTRAAVGRNCQEYVAHGDRARMPAALENLRENDLPKAPVAYSGLREDGTTFDAEVTSAPVRDDRGEPEALIAQIQDVSARTAAEAMRSRSEAELRLRLGFESLLTRTATALAETSAGDLDRAMPGILRPLGEYLGTDRCMVSRRDRERGTSKVVYHWSAEGLEPRPPAGGEIIIAEYADLAARADRGEILFLKDDDDASEPARRLIRTLGLRSLLLIPMIVEGRNMGALGFGSRRARWSWPETLLSLLSVAGDLFGSALARVQTEQHLVETTDQLHQLAEHLHDVREEEQRRLARELHDELGQMLTALKFNLTWLRDQPACQGTIHARIESMTGTTDALLEQTRRIAAGLRPGMLDTLGLGAAAEWQVRAFEGRFGIRCRLQIEPPDLVADDATSTALFRILQESLTNVARHARASAVEVELFARDEVVGLLILDDGVGIDENDLVKHGSYGILGMRERLIPLGGELTITARPEGGTAVEVAVPLGEERTL